MFFGINLAMIILEQKSITSKSKDKLSEIFKVLSETENPNSYKHARFYLLGTIVSFLMFAIFLEFGYA